MVLIQRPVSDAAWLAKVFDVAPLRGDESRDAKPLKVDFISSRAGLQRSWTRM